MPKVRKMEPGQYQGREVDVRVKRLMVSMSVGLALNGSPVSAQGLADQLRQHQPFQNLEILDPATSAEELAVTMQEISRAIGSERGCLFCHEGVSGQPLSSWDFAADSKVQKEVARTMLRMVESMNADYLADLPGRNGPATVTCRTCHAARPRPIPLEDVLLEALHAGDVREVEARYRSLRQRYYAADAYDFNEYVLRRLVSRLRTEEADAQVSILELNLEFYPESWRSLLMMGEAYLSLSEPELAELSFQRSLAIQVSDDGVQGVRRAREAQR